MATSLPAVAAQISALTAEDKLVFLVLVCKQACFHRCVCAYEFACVCAFSPLHAMEVPTMLPVVAAQNFALV